MTDENDAIAIPTAPPGGSNQRVLLGCGIGCGLLIFVVIVLTVALFFLGDLSVTKMDGMSRPYLEREYPVWKEEGIISADQSEVYDALYGTVFDDELGSRWVTICVLIMMEYHIDDSTVTEGEIEQAKGLIDDIHEQPGLGFKYWVEFLQSDEELQKIWQKVVRLVQPE